MLFRAFFILCAVISIAVPAVAHAEGLISLKGDVRVVRVVEADGTKTEVFEEPSKVVPGDTLLFDTAYDNETGQAVDDFVITNPLPQAVTLARDGDFDVSVNGGKSWGRLTALTVDGESGARQAKLKDVTHVRWILPHLEVGARGKVSYLAVVR